MTNKQQINPYFLIINSSTHKTNWQQKPFKPKKWNAEPFKLFKPQTLQTLQTSNPSNFLKVEHGTLQTSNLSNGACDIPIYRGSSNSSNLKLFKLFKRGTRNSSNLKPFKPFKPITRNAEHGTRNVLHVFFLSNLYNLAARWGTPSSNSSNMTR